MKTLTTTFHFVHNYGAVLQTYALQQFLFKMGFENLVIDYRYFEPTLFRKLGLPNNRSNIKSYMDDLTILFHFRECREKYNRFESFISNYIKKTNRIYDIDEALFLNADAYITGSDQVWNLANGIIHPYELPFNDNSIKVSYAASMGKVDESSIDPIALNYFMEEIKKFKCISVREPEARNFLIKNGCHDVCIHIDPIFLLTVDDWKAIIGNPIEKPPYICCYQLLSNKYVNPLLKKLRAQTGYKVISLCPSGANLAQIGKKIYNAGPIEFLNYIYYASKIVTTSFHGTAFSILFHKDFYSLNNSASPGRISNLLSSLGCGLQDRLLQTAGNISYNNIDYSKVDEEIQRERNRSYDYFAKALNNVNLSNER